MQTNKNKQTPKERKQKKEITKIILCGLLGVLIYGFFGLLIITVLKTFWPVLLLLAFIGAFFGVLHLWVKYNEEKESREFLEMKENVLRYLRFEVLT